MHPLVRGFLDLLYPPRCEACGRLGEAPICEECLAQIELVEAPVCRVCGEPFDPLAQAAPTCLRCRSGRRAFTRARAAAYYAGPLVQAIYRFKYYGQMVLGRPLGRLMVEALERGPAAELEVEKVDLVCPVPLHPSRLRERGFNQSALLAEEVAEARSLPVRPLLARVRPTLPQVDLPPSSRRANVHNAFAPRLQEEIAGKRVLLVDDLFTTGATLTECARALRRGEAAEVKVLTLARPLPQWRRPGADLRAAASNQ